MKHSDKLGKEKISKLLVSLSIPSIIGMLAISIYHIADTIFIGHGVGSMAIAGVAVALPLLLTLNVFGHAIGIGGASIVSRALGAGDKEKAAKTLNSLLFVIIIINFVIYSVAYIFLETFLTVFGANHEIMPYAYDYSKIALIGSFFLNILFVVMNIIRAEGNARFPMKIQLLAAGLNVILNPIFIFVFEWGVAGAAFATSISQFLGALLSILYFTAFKRSELTLSLNKVFSKPDFNIVKECFAIGASSFARQSATSVMTIALNNSLLLYSGSMGVAAFGIIYRLAMFIFMPLFGINQGFMPIAGYNYGAKNYLRVQQVIKTAVIYSTALCVFAFVGFRIFATGLVSLFTSDAELIEIASGGLKIIIVAFPVIGFQIIGSGLFQSLGKAWSALFLALSRQVLFLIPLILILPAIFGTTGIWYSFPAADILAALITAVMVLYQLRRIKAETT
jgi:putative MATE family efflux protein